MLPRIFLAALYDGKCAFAVCICFWVIFFFFVNTEDFPEINPETANAPGTTKGMETEETKQAGFDYNHEYNEERANASTELMLNVKEVKEKQWEAAKQETDFAVSVDYEEGKERIIFSEPSDKSVLNEIPVTKDQGESFEAVWAEDERYFRYGYVPLFDKERGRAYLILEAENEYFVYQTEYPAADGGDSWNLVWESGVRLRWNDEQVHN